MKNNFPKQYHLLKSEEYDFVFFKSYKVSQLYFSIIAKKNKFNYPRLGLIVSKKTIKKATKRNKFKRISRESFRKNQDQIKGLDVLIISKKNADAASNIEFRKNLDEQWEKLKKHFKI